MGVKHKSPGPAAYTIQNTVGSDTPAFSFGSMKRPSPGGATMSPGPVYQLKTSVGRNKDLIFRHNPSFGFGTMERPDPAGNSKLRECPAQQPHLPLVDGGHRTAFGGLLFHLHTSCPSPLSSHLHTHMHKHACMFRLVSGSGLVTQGSVPELGSSLPLSLSSCVCQAVPCANYCLAW
jgi:hypothetical protein